MTAFQLRALEWLQECARVASEGVGHTPESRTAFQTAVARQQHRDEAARASRDLFGRIQSDNRPTTV